jgi:hypothetical protein
MELEEFAVVARSAADAERLWREHLLRAEAAWQPPGELAACIRALVRALDARPDVLTGLRPRSGVSAAVARYYSHGGLRDDLVDLLLMADWAEVRGVRYVRLVAR